MNAETARLWYPNFTPCAAELVEGYGNRICSIEHTPREICLKHSAFLMTKFVLEGSTIDEELREIASYLRPHRGERIIDILGQRVPLTDANLGEALAQVRRQCCKILAGIEACTKNTRQITPEAISCLPLEQQAVLRKLYDLNRKANEFRGNQAQAQVLVSEIGTALASALDMGLGKFGVIARNAIAYGQADKLGFVDPTGLLFIGNPDQIVRLR